MSYTELLVESLIPAVWDQAFAWGIQNEYAPDVDMPRAKRRCPLEATTFWAHIVDIRIAWEHCPLTMFERRALFLAYGLGMEQAEIAANQEVSQQAISKRLAKGVDKLTGWLNAYYETEEERDRYSVGADRPSGLREDIQSEEARREQ